ncbi:MAG: hypothetical protein M3O36_08975 [Myxococcota bacterium]|nr:hypothetical protein [Myxococcota bacterium]
MGTSKDDLANAASAVLAMAETWADSKKPTIQTAEEMNLIAAIARYRRIRDERKRNPSLKPRPFENDEQPTLLRQPRKRRPSSPA